MGTLIRINGKVGIDVEDWAKRYSAKLTYYSLNFVRKVVDVGRDKGLSFIKVGGWRSARSQCEAIVENWKTAYNAGGEEAALAWANDVYKTRGPMLHRKYLAINSGKMSMNEYVADFLRRNMRKARHDNGRAFDVTPRNSRVYNVLKTALREGTPLMYTPYGGKTKKGEPGIVPEKNPPHFHIQLGPPHTYINFADEEALEIYG